MSEPNERLQKARRDIGFANASEAARAFRWNENTYRSHENGERGIKPAAAARYARAFRVSTSWLLTGEGPAERPQWALINSEIRDSSEIIVKDFAPDLEAPWEVDLPVSIPDVAGVTFVRTNKLWPRYDIAALIVSWREQEDEAQNSFFKADSRYAALVDIGDSTYLKDIVREKDTDLYTVFSHDRPAEAHVKVENISPVRLIIPFRSWSYRHNDPIQVERFGLSDLDL